MRPYLVLTRREGDKITLRAEPGTNVEDLLAQLLLEGITVTVKEMKRGRVQIGIEVPKSFNPAGRADRGMSAIVPPSEARA